MPASIRAHLATTPDGTSSESLAVLADRAIASENDAKENSVGVAEVRVNDREKLIGIMEDISRRLKKLETSGHQKKHYNNKQQTTRRRDNTTENIIFSWTLMRDRLHLAWLQITLVMKKMTKMLLPQKYQIPARPLARSTAELAANRYRTANGYGRCTDLLLSSEIWW